MDHRRALEWAEGHLEALKASISEYTEKHPIVLVTKHDYVTGEQVVSFRIRPLPHISEKWTFRIGDTLHNLRVALDYLTFRIVAKHPGGPAVQKISFPISEDPTLYPGLQGRRIGKAVPDAFKIAVESLQPYNGANGANSDPLFWLDSLENVHKHRHLLDAGMAITSIGIRGNDPGVVKITSGTLPAGPLDDGAEVYRYVFVDPEKTKTDMKLFAASHVCFNKKGPAGGRIVIHTLESIRDHIRDNVFPKLEPFL